MSVKTQNRSLDDRIVHQVGHTGRCHPAVQLVADELADRGRAFVVGLLGERGRGRPLGAVAVGRRDVRRDPPRTQAGDADRRALGPQLLVEALAEGDDRPLARRVRAVPGVVPGHRRGVDDVAVAVLEEVGQERAVAVDDAPQVDAEHPAPVVEVDPERRSSSPPRRRCCTRGGRARSAPGRRRATDRRRRHRRRRSARRAPRRRAPSRPRAPRRAAAPRRRRGRRSSRRRRSARRTPAPSRWPRR